MASAIVHIDPMGSEVKRTWEDHGQRFYAVEMPCPFSLQVPLPYYDGRGVTITLYAVVAVTIGYPNYSKVAAAGTRLGNQTLQEAYVMISYLNRITNEEERIEVKRPFIQGDYPDFTVIVDEAKPAL